MDKKETALTSVEQQRQIDNQKFIENQEAKKVKQSKSQESKVESVEGSEITSKILKRHGVTTIQEGEKGDKAKEPAVETKQVEATEPGPEITDQEFEALDKAGVKEEDLDGKTIEEIKTLAQGSVKPQEKKVSQESITITEAIASKFGFAKNLVGKTLDDVLQVIDNQNSYITDLEFKAKKEAIESTNKQEKKTEEVLKVEPIDFINLSPEEQATKLDEMIGVRAEAIADARVEKKIKELLPTLEPLQKQSEKAALNEFYTSLADRLPDNVKTPAEAKKVMDDWNVATKDKYSKDDLMALANSPNAMIELISTHYILNNAKAEIKVTKETADKTIKKQTYEKVRKLIIDSKKLGAGAKFNYKRTKKTDGGLGSEEGTEEEQMMGKIIARNLPR